VTLRTLTEKAKRALEKAVVRAAKSWFYCDQPVAGRPSGLRMLTAAEVWKPNAAELRLARRVAKLLDAEGK